METLLNEQRQLHEDLQAELEEAVERGASLGDRCSSLEDQLIKVMKEAELERLRAVEAVRSKYEEKFLQQVQELQRQVRDLQSSVKVTTSGGNGSHTRTLTEDTAKPSDSEFTNQHTTVSAGTACTTDKVDGPDSTGSTGHACGETNEVTLSQQSGALSEALMAQQLPLPSKFSGSDLPSEETFEEWITHFELVASVECTSQAHSFDHPPTW